jgi:hypothetical protein
MQVVYPKYRNQQLKLHIHVMNTMAAVVNWMSQENLTSTTQVT